MRTKVNHALLEHPQDGVARYLQLSTLFRRKIETGDWLVGEQIPTVDELADTFGVAKLTIRRALGLLERDGVIERFRARGTFVRAKPARELWCEVKTDFAGMLTARRGARIEVLDERRRSGLPEGERPIGVPAPSYRALRRRHSRVDEPFLLARLYIDERLTRSIPKAAYTTKTALRLITDVPGLDIVRVHQTLTIGGADLETAALLAIPINSPVAFVDRIAVARDGSIALLALGTYRGDVVRLDMQTSSLPGARSSA
jgi:GntR family transcriptional regulator